MRLAQVPKFSLSADDKRAWLQAFVLGTACYFVLAVAVIIALIPCNQGVITGTFCREKTWSTFVKDWDGRHYFNIAHEGYPWGTVTQQIVDSGGLGPGNWDRWAFFPVYPFLLKILQFFGLNFVAAAMLVSWLSVVAIFYCCLQLGRRWQLPVYSAVLMGFTLISIVPMTTIVRAYNDVFSMALIVTSFYQLAKGKSRTAIIIAGIAAAVRVTGLIALCAVLATLVLKFLLNRKIEWRLLPYAALSFIPWAAFNTAANWVTREIGGYKGLQRAGWGGRFDRGEQSRDLIHWSFTSGAVEHLDGKDPIGSVYFRLMGWDLVYLTVLFFIVVSLYLIYLGYHLPSWRRGTPAVAPLLPVAALLECLPFVLAGVVQFVVVWHLNSGLPESHLRHLSGFLVLFAPFYVLRNRLPNLAHRLVLGLLLLQSVAALVIGLFDATTGWAP